MGEAGWVPTFKSEYRNKCYKDNVEVMDLVGPPYTWSNNKTCMLIREDRMPSVDYYPSTNKWKHSNNRIFFGNAGTFLKWYNSLNVRGEF